MVLVGASTIRSGEDTWLIDDPGLFQELDSEPAIACDFLGVGARRRGEYGGATRHQMVFRGAASPIPCEICVIPACFHVLLWANAEVQRPTAQG